MEEVQAIMQKHVYQSGLNCLYVAAVESQKKIEEKYLSKQKEIKFLEEHPENENILDEYGMMYSKLSSCKFEIVELVQSIQEVRKVFILASYHYWEKFISEFYNSNEELKKNNSIKLYGIDNLIKASEKLGFFTDEKINIVNNLCNIIKHDSENSSKNIRENEIELFKDLKTPDILFKDTIYIYREDEYYFSEELLNQVFEIIKRSGPIYDRESTEGILQYPS